MEFNVIFRRSEGKSPIMIQISPNMKVYDIIQRYIIKAYDLDPDKRFMFNAKRLNPILTAAEQGLNMNSNIFVISNGDKSDSELNELKQKIESQNITIDKLNKELKKTKELIKTKDYKINELENKLNYIKEESYYNLAKSISTIEILEKKIKEKDFELENLKKNNFNIKDEKMVKESQIAVINFSSSDQKVHYATSCLNSTIFAEIEEKLYQIYPEYRETNNTFMANGKTILRFKTVSENGIGNGFPIILYQPNDE